MNTETTPTSYDGPNPAYTKEMLQAELTNLQQQLTKIEKELQDDVKVRIKKLQEQINKLTE